MTFGPRKIVPWPGRRVPLKAINALDDERFRRYVQACGRFFPHDETVLEAEIETLHEILEALREQVATLTSCSIGSSPLPTTRPGEKVAKPARRTTARGLDVDVR